MKNISEQVVYITGASTGIGYGVAEVLLRAGARVALSSRSYERAEAAARRLGGGDRVLAIQSDVAHAENERAAVRQVLDKWGRLDVLVANAGVGHFAPIDELSDEHWHETINTNLTGVFHSVKASLEPLKKEGGYIITIASLAGANFFENGSAYNASKFGLVGFSQAIMLDLRKYDVKVTTIMPGSVATEFNGNEPSEKDAWKIQPEDIGELVHDLLRMHPRTLPSKVEVRPSRPK